MISTCIVRIWVPIRASGIAWEQATSGLIGTGFQVAPDLILTARHVVVPSSRDPSRPIAIRWQSTPAGTPGDGWLDLDADDSKIVAWSGSDEVDVALLRCHAPAYASSGRLVRTPTVGVDWEGWGYPKASEKGQSRELEPFGGKLHPQAAGQSWLTLTVDAAPVDSELWKGASGMAIMRAGTSDVVAVGFFAPENFAARRLRAIPTSTLLNDAPFRVCLGIEEDEDKYVAWVNAAIIEILNEAPKCTAFIVDVLRERLGLAPTSYEPGPLAEAICRHGFAAFKDGLEDILRAAQKTLHKTDNQRLCEVLRRVATVAVPLLYDEVAARHLRREIREGADLCLVPAFQKEVAEVFVARAEHRDARYQPRRSGEDNPRASLCIESGPESGIGDVNDFKAGLDVAVAAKVLPDGPEFGRWRAGIDDAAFAHVLPGSVKRMSLSPEDRIKAVSAKLKARRRKGDGYYAIVPSKAGETDQPSRGNVLRRAKSDYPDLLLLELSQDKQRLFDEIERLTAFFDLHPLGDE